MPLIVYLHPSLGIPGGGCIVGGGSLFLFSYSLEGRSSGTFDMAADSHLSNKVSITSSESSNGGNYNGGVCVCDFWFLHLIAPL